MKAVGHLRKSSNGLQPTGIFNVLNNDFPSSGRKVTEWVWAIMSRV